MSLIALCSGKGSPGATFSSVNLAAALARASSRVLLADLDASGGDIAAYLRLDARHGLTPLVAMHGGTPSADAIAAEAVTRAGIGVLAGIEDPAALAGFARAELLAQLRSTGAQVVCDFGRVEANTAPDVREADVVLLVVRPDLISVLGAQRALGFIGEWCQPERVSFVLNCARRGHPGDLAEVADALGIDCAGVVPLDQRGARVAMRSQQPAASKRLAEAFDQLGRNLSARPRPANLVAAPMPAALGSAVAS